MHRLDQRAHLRIDHGCTSDDDGACTSHALPRFTKASERQQTTAQPACTRIHEHKIKIARNATVLESIIQNDASDARITRHDMPNLIEPPRANSEAYRGQQELVLRCLIRKSTVASVSTKRNQWNAPARKCTRCNPTHHGALARAAHFDVPHGYHRNTEVVNANASVEARVSRTNNGPIGGGCNPRGWIAPSRQQAFIRTHV